MPKDQMMKFSGHSNRVLKRRFPWADQKCPCLRPARQGYAQADRYKLALRNPACGVPLPAAGGQNPVDKIRPREEWGLLGRTLFLQFSLLNYEVVLEPTSFRRDDLGRKNDQPVILKKWSCGKVRMLLKHLSQRVSGP